MQTGGQPSGATKIGMQKFLPREESLLAERLFARKNYRGLGRKQVLRCPGARFATTKLQLLQKRLRIARIHRADREVQFTALSVATEGAAPGEVAGSGRIFPAASVS